MQKLQAAIMRPRVRSWNAHHCIGFASPLWGFEFIPLRSEATSKFGNEGKERRSLVLPALCCEFREAFFSNALPEISCKSDQSTQKEIVRSEKIETAEQRRDDARSCIPPAFFICR